MTAVRTGYPRILPLNNINRFRPSYMLFFEAVFDVSGRQSTTISNVGNVLTSSTGYVNIQADTVKFSDVAISTSGDVGNILITDTTTTASFSQTPVTGGETGMIRYQATSTIPDGWITLDDGTIGNASSGATTRANSDTEDLFILLWNSHSDAICPVSSGRGATAAADFAANKTLTLPPTASRALCGSGSGSGLSARSQGETDGEETHTITSSELVTHGHWMPYRPSGIDVAVSLNGYGTRDYLEVETGTTPDGSTSMGSNTGDQARSNMELTTFLKAIIKL